MRRFVVFLLQHAAGIALHSVTFHYNFYLLVGRRVMIINTLYRASPTTEIAIPAEIYGHTPQYIGGILVLSMLLVPS